MKRTSTALIFLLVLLGAASSLLAGIINTRHNLAHWSPYQYKARSDVVNPESEVCKFCHTPHRGNPATPLWGHRTTTYSFQKYSSATLVIDDPDVVDDSLYNELKGTSKLCLSCHDGLTSLGTLVIGNIDMTRTNLGGLDSGYDSGGAIDIRNKHPVSFEYYSGGLGVGIVNQINARKVSLSYDFPSTSRNGTSANSWVAGKWRAEGERVECNICHDPHENRADTDRDQLPFWVSPSMNGYSSYEAVCAACHDPNFGEYTGFAEYSSLW